VSVLEAGVALPVAAVVSLSASALAVSRLERVATRLGLSEAALGLLVALAGDAPEITSAVTAMVGGQADIGAGVVLGSNVFNLAALLGLGALVAGRIRLHRRVVSLEGVVALWVAVVCVVVLATPLGPAPGLGLVAAGVGPYLAVSVLPEATLGRLGVPAAVCAWCRRAVSEETVEISPALEHPPYRPRDLPVGALGLAVVVAASSVMERSAQSLGAHWQLSGLVVGGVVLAVVTSLPNAVGALYLARRGRGAAVLSEALNSNMLNVVAGLFLPGVIVGLGRTGGYGIAVAAWYAGLTSLGLVLAWYGRGLRRLGGAALVAGYLAFLAVALSR